MAKLSRYAPRAYEQAGAIAVVISPTHITLFSSSVLPSCLVDRYDKYREKLIGVLPMLRSIDFHPVPDSARPQTVEVITARKLKSGHISEQERKHIIKVHKLLLALEGSNELLALYASSDDEEDEEEEDDDGEEGEDKEEEAEESKEKEDECEEAVNDDIHSARDDNGPLSPGNHKAYPDMSKTDSLNVFTKVTEREVGVIVTYHKCRASA